LTEAVPDIITAMQINGCAPLHHIHIEHCEHCERHNTTTWHIPGSYESHARAVATAIRSRLPPNIITSNKSSKKPPRCGAFEVTFTPFPNPNLSKTSPPQLLFSKLAGNGFPSPQAVVAAVSSLILPKRVSFPGGEHFAYGLSHQRKSQYPGAAPLAHMNQKPRVSVTITSSFFEAEESEKRLRLPLAGIKCELLFVEVRNSLQSSSLIIGDNVGFVGEDLILKETHDHRAGKGMPRDRDKIPLTKKQRLTNSIREARKIAKLSRDVQGYEHVRTWGKQRVFEFLEAYGISMDGLTIFDELGINNGAALLKCAMQTLDHISSLGAHGHNKKPDLLKKVDKEKLMNGINALRDGTTFTASGGGNSSEGMDNHGAFATTLDLSDLPNAGGGDEGMEELRFTGLTPRESPVTLHSADVQITHDDGTATLSAPIYGAYIVRCFALGYFSACSNIIRFTQPRSPHDYTSIHSITLRMVPRLRKVSVALVDPQDDDPKKKIKRVGAEKFKGLPIFFVHTDTGTKHHGKADAKGLVKFVIPPGTYALSVDMQILVIPNPNPNLRKDPRQYIADNAKNSVVASSDWRAEIFLRTNGNRALAKRREFIMMAGMRVAAVINRKVAVIRQRKRHASIMLQATIRVRGVRRRLKRRREAATYIKAWYKSAKILYMWNVMRRGAIFTQAQYRGYAYGRKLARQRARAGAIIRRYVKFWAQRLGMFWSARAGKIIAQWRGFLQRKRFRSMVVAKKGQDAAGKIQNVLYRGVMVRHWYHAHKFAAVSLAAGWRRQKVLRWFSDSHTGALKFQKNWKMHKERARYRRTLDAVLLIQKRARMLLAKR